MYLIIPKKNPAYGTPTLSTNAYSRTNTILERLHVLPIRTKKWTCPKGPPTFQGKELSKTIYFVESYDLTGQL